MAPGSAGLRVYLDPETGDVMDGVDPNAVAELDPEMENALRHDSEGLTTIRHADGSESLNLDERYQEASVVRIDENGKRFFCNADPAAVKRNLNETASTLPEVK